MTVTSVTADPGGRVSVCEIRDLSVWQALRIFDEDFRRASMAELTGAGSVAYCLRQAALEMVIAEQMRVRAVISVHRALLGGVSVSEVAHVIGSSCADVARQWRDWAEGQRHLNTLYPRLGLDQREYDQVAAVIDRADGDAEDKPPLSFTQCACPVTSTQIGSPRP
jgi:hypothetical protein